MYEQTLADRERILGNDHPQSIAVRDRLVALRQNLADGEGR